MKHIGKLILTILCGITAISFCSAQNTKSISGKIIDENGTVLEYAHVLMYADSIFLGGTVANEQGAFLLDSVMPKTNTITVEMLGYETISIPISDVKRGGTIRMRQSATQIGEVTVNATAKHTKIIGEAMVTGVENSLLATAGTANDVLSHLPMVVGKDGEFTVVGRGTPDIYVNGRLVRNTSELEQLRSDAIKSVEVISNPGAKYGAEVSSVIKIKTKRQAGEGLGGDFYTRNYYDHYFYTRNQLNLKYTTGGLQVFTTGYITQGKDRAVADFKQTTYGSEVWYQDLLDHSIDKYTRWNGKAGLSYIFSENHSIGGYYKYSSEDSDKKGSIKSSVDVDGKAYDKWDATFTGNTQNKPHHEANIYYNGTFGETEIDFNTDYLRSDKKSCDNQTELSENFDDQIVKTFSSNNNELYAEKLTATTPLWNGDITVGEEYTHSKINYRNESEGTAVGNGENDIRENNIAVFAEYSKTLGKVDFTAGLRYEHINYEYMTDGNKNADQSRTYDNLFPSLSIGTNLGNVNLSLSFANKTKRPTYQQLDGNISYINRITYQSGNPYLKPVKIYNLQLMAMWKTFYAQAFYQKERNSIFYSMKEYENNPLIRLLMYENSPKYSKSQIVIGSSHDIGAWNVNPQVALAKQWYTTEFRGEDFSIGKPLMYIELDNTLKLPKDWKITLDIEWNSNGNMENAYIKSRNSIDLGVSKSFLNNRLILQLKGIDILNNDHQSIKMYDGDILIEEDERNNYTRTLMLTLSYKFNTSKNKYKGTGAGTAEKNRIE
jgi:hypothetical protein